MTLRWTDSVQTYANATDVYVTYENGRLDEGINTTASRRGGKCFKGNYQDREVRKTFDNQATWIAGMACYWTGFNDGRDGDLISFYEGTTTQCCLYIDSETQQLTFRRGTLTVLDTAIEVPISDTWYYFEVKVTINDTTGSFEVKMNGSTIMSGSSVDTQETSSSAYANRIGWSSAAVGGNSMYWHDLYACDGTGSDNNDFLGDVEVNYYAPNANGNYTAWTGDYTNVEEYVSDGDTSYIESGTVDQIDSFPLETIPSGGDIKGIRLIHMDRKDSVDTRKIKALLYINSIDYLQSETELTEAYKTYSEFLDLNPDDSLAWELSDLNGMEIGVKVTT